MSDGLYLDESAFTEWVRLGAIAKTLKLRIDRPEREGDPYVIRQYGVGLYDAADLSALRDWLEAE